MSLEYSQNNSDSDRPPEPYPAELGDISRAFIEELAQLGKRELREKLRSASDAMIDRILSSGYESISMDRIEEALRTRSAERANASENAAPRMQPNHQNVMAASRSTETQSLTDSVRPLIWKGGWDGTEYYLTAEPEQESPGLVRITLKRVLGDDEGAYMGGEKVNVVLPDGETQEVELWPDGESDPDQGPSYPIAMFENERFIEISIADGLVISLFRLKAR